MKINEHNTSNTITNDIIHKIPDEHSDTCIPQEIIIKDVRLARAYVPIEKYCSTYKPLEALNKGTSFPELYVPYTEDFKHNHLSNT